MSEYRLDKCECRRARPRPGVECVCGHGRDDHDAGECWNGFDAVIFDLLEQWESMMERLRENQ